MRIALCDDDEAQREKLKAAVDRHLVSRGYRPRYEEYSGGGPLVAEVAAGTDPFDLVFLDVYLEGDDGIAVARKLREHDPSVPLVFLTVSREHAVESYEVQATSYLVKPAEPRKLAAVLDRVLPVTSPRLAFRVGSARRYFDYRNIAYLESRDHAVLLHQADGSCHRSLAKLDDVADELERPPLPALPSQLHREHGLHRGRARRLHPARRHLRARAREGAPQDARGLLPLLHRRPLRRIGEDRPWQRPSMCPPP